MGWEVVGGGGSAHYIDYYFQGGSESALILIITFLRQNDPPPCIVNVRPAQLLALLDPSDPLGPMDLGGKVPEGSARASHPCRRLGHWSKPRPEGKHIKDTRSRHKGNRYRAVFSIFLFAATKFEASRFCMSTSGQSRRCSTFYAFP